MYLEISDRSHLISDRKSFINLRLAGLRLSQAAFRDLVPGRSVHGFNGSCHRDEGGLRQAHVSV